jgi:hypothetical protein
MRIFRWRCVFVFSKRRFWVWFQLRCSIKYYRTEVSSQGQRLASIPSISPSASTPVLRIRPKGQIRLLRSDFQCEQLNLQRSFLIGTSITATGGNLACAYGDGTLCTYSEVNRPAISLTASKFLPKYQGRGTLAYGFGLCPPTVSKVCASGGGIGGSSRLADNANIVQGGGPSPTLITLIALNGVLLLVSLATAGVWLSRRCAKKCRTDHCRPLNLGNQSDEFARMPLTHHDGSDEAGPYSDYRAVDKVERN